MLAYNAFYGESKLVSMWGVSLFEFKQVLVIAIDSSTCDAVGMAKIKVSIPDKLPTSPLSLVCPLCGAEPDQDCIKISHNLSIIHVPRIAAAALVDNKAKRKRR
jgi:hypothetical protein